MISAILAVLLVAPLKPNIVLMVIDDLGWRDLGYSGSDLYQTPNIDRISAAGVRFTRAYSAHPVCSPTRAAIMTGKNPVRVGITDWIPGDRPNNRPLIAPTINNQLALAEVTIAESLKREGYRTYSVGKWHLGGNGFRPEDQGFEVNVGGSHIGQPGSYFLPYGENVNPMPAGGDTGEYLTDRLTDEAIKLVGRADKRPFFLYFPHYAVHTPIQAKAEDTDKFADAAKASAIHKNPRYAAMIWNLDQNVGRLIAHLEAKGVMKNTLFIFTSDNGGLSPVTNNAPLRASKGLLYEGGIRVPAFAFWPGTIAGGKEVGEPVISMDFSATVLEAGASKAKTQDGHSLLPALLGAEFTSSQPFIWHYPQYHSSGQTPSSGILDGDWKALHFYEDDRTELYNLRSDPSERRDLQKEQPDKAKQLWRKLKKSLDEMGAQYPQTRH